MTIPNIVVLGAGPAGLGAAFKLAQSNKARVTVLESQPFVGGNAGSFELAGIMADYGSHRLHPATDPAILADIRGLLGDELTDQPRHGRIRLSGRWIHFPLQPFDLALRLPPGFVAGIVQDLAGRAIRKLWPSGAHNGTTPGAVGSENFATVLEASLGETICRDFYFPYARKLWGMEPKALSATQARRRVSASSVRQMVGKVLPALPGFGRPMSGRFYYPRRGFGQICQAYAAAARAHGADIRLGATASGVDLSAARPVVEFEHHGSPQTLTADYVWSTIPITSLARIVRPAVPSNLMAAAGRINYRAMILVYLVLETDRFTEYDAHYFPETAVPISRLSEPKNYSRTTVPPGRTVLCAELPCAPADPIWQLDDDALGELVSRALASVGLPVTVPVSRVVTRRLRQAYPIYSSGYEQFLEPLLDWLQRFDRLLSFGRQGLFAHDNTHHALYMAYAAVDCLEANGRFDHDKWTSYRTIFATHVVED